ncbi:Hypothetical predicted protein [Mytilus galloprovincialis]|uniref:Uncharacterized protein n=1 Tax=Mytilus galloprovincialis TaxID=29158 RepID=A0A8B6F8M0_MYTGA|nr:Hypothetical predicted protein [Mytilus galloprovincialis]
MFGREVNLPVELMFRLPLDWDPADLQGYVSGLEEDVRSAHEVARARQDLPLPVSAPVNSPGVPIEWRVQAVIMGEVGDRAEAFMEMFRLQGSRAASRSDRTGEGRSRSSEVLNQCKGRPEIPFILHVGGLPGTAIVLYE